MRCSRRLVWARPMVKKPLNCVVTFVDYHVFLNTAIPLRREIVHENRQRCVSTDPFRSTFGAALADRLPVKIDRRCVKPGTSLHGVNIGRADGSAEGVVAISLVETGPIDMEETERGQSKIP